MRCSSSDICQWSNTQSDRCTSNRLKNVILSLFGCPCNRPRITSSSYDQETPELTMNKTTAHSKFGLADGFCIAIVIALVAMIVAQARDLCSSTSEMRRRIE